MTLDSGIAQNAELVIGLVGAVGTDLERVTTLLAGELKTFRYNTTLVDNGENRIRLSSLLHQLPKYQSLTKIKDEYEYIREHMNAGDDFRKTTGQNDALAVLAIFRIIKLRESLEKENKLQNKIVPRQAYILRSLKNPAELMTLREIYGDAFYLVAAYSPRKVRRQNLALKISARRRLASSAFNDKAEELIQRDEEELGILHGQNVSGLFHQADIFINATDDVSTMRQSLRRFVRLIFGDTFNTPTRAEYAMFHAHAASLRSAELGRQVGAVIATNEGDIVAVGCNEVPKPGGGTYWYPDKPDGREFVEEYDTGAGTHRESNEDHIRSVIRDNLSDLKNAGWLSPERSILSEQELLETALAEEGLRGIAPDVLKPLLSFLKKSQWLSAGKSQLSDEDLLELAISGNPPAIPKGSRIRSLIEFGRAVHAEMAALTDAAKRGVSVDGCIMYVNVWPCHLCARHIVSAGITKLIYIEPYAKSLAAELYPDSIEVEGGTSDKVSFEPFVGVSPRQYIRLFEMTKRKTKDGMVLRVDPSTANLRYSALPRTYLRNEDDHVQTLINIMTEKKLWPPA
jgi:cytidine deaminase